MINISFNWFDLINSLFEISGGFFIGISILKTYKDKIVRGVSWLTVSFFAVWGYWNLFYYPSLNQWLSFSGGVFIVTMNTIWIVQLIYYTYKEKND